MQQLRPAELTVIFSTGEGNCRGKDKIQECIKHNGNKNENWCVCREDKKWRLGRQVDRAITKLLNEYKQRFREDDSGSCFKDELKRHLDQRGCDNKPGDSMTAEKIEACPQ